MKANLSIRVDKKGSRTSQGGGISVWRPDLEVDQQQQRQKMPLLPLVRISGALHYCVLLHVHMRVLKFVDHSCQILKKNRLCMNCTVHAHMFKLFHTLWCTTYCTLGYIHGYIYEFSGLTQRIQGPSRHCMCLNAYVYVWSLVTCLPQ